MDSVSGELERLTAKTWSWKLGNKDQKGRWFSPQFSVNKYFNTLFFSIHPNTKIPEYGKFLLAEECRKDDLTDKRVCGLQVVLSYTGKEKELSIEAKCTETTENLYLYYLEDIKTSNLLKITCTFLKMKVSFKTVGEAGEPNVIEERKEEAGASEKTRQNTKSNILDKLQGFTELSKDLYKAFDTEMDRDVILKVCDQSYPAHKVVLRNRSSVLEEHAMTESNGTIVISDCNPHIFKIFLLYLYTGMLDNLSKENVFELYHMARKYNVKQLALACKNYIDNISNLAI